MEIRQKAYAVDFNKLWRLFLFCFPVEAVEFGCFQGGHHYFKSCWVIKLKGNMQRWHQQNWETDSLSFYRLPNQCPFLLLKIITHSNSIYILFNTSLWKLLLLRGFTFIRCQAHITKRNLCLNVNFLQNVSRQKRDFLEQDLTGSFPHSHLVAVLSNTQTYITFTA